MQHVVQNNDDIKIESDIDSSRIRNSSTPCTPPYSPPRSPPYSPPSTPPTPQEIIAEAFRYISSGESSGSVEELTDVSWLLNANLV